MGGGVVAVGFASGLTGLILIQAFINLYAVMGWAPLTGIPLDKLRELGLLDREAA